jgi:glycosyltransferase involved in cell wall biosynthesis
MKSKKSKISVIIPVYNEEEDISTCISSLNKQSKKPSEIIVVDDGSSDDSLNVISKFKGVKILQQDHKGPGAARNLGAKKANGDILIFVDSDMSFDKDYIKNLVLPLERNKEIVGTTHNYEEVKINKTIWSKLWGNIRVDEDSAKDVKIFRAIRKNKFLEFGGFDSKYGYADDQTFWYKYNIRPYVAINTVCYHRNPESLKSTYKQARWIGASWKERFLVFRMPAVNYLTVLILFLLLPGIIIYKSFKTKTNYASFFDKFRFYSYKFFGYSVGTFRAIYLGKVWK